jgi:hypothetical protein
VRQFAAKVERKLAHGPKEIDVEARILGTRLRITRAYRNYGADGVLRSGHADVDADSLVQAFHQIHVGQPTERASAAHPVDAIWGQPVACGRRI